ncbi:enoyl-CoA hydratase-related protein [Sphingobium sp.]|uniref:enoyl-CoA hydratase-related protein n=1 Tax=Sphingobium sp. TaxID=1912891 RepID=UPI003BB6D1E7
MTYNTIGLRIEGNMAVVQLQRPEKLNAVSLEMAIELRHVLAQIQTSDTLRVLLLTGAGRAFCAGADLSDPGTQTADVLTEQFNPLVRALADFPFPIVAGINGAAVGIGCSIALMADIVMAGQSAYFLQTFARVALAPDGGASWSLPKLIGLPRAKAMLLLGDRITAAQAEEWGLIYRAVSDDRLSSEAAALASRLADGPTYALGITRRGLHASLEQGLDEALAREAADQAAAAMSSDHKEAVAAFLAKRPVSFAGR